MATRALTVSAPRRRRPARATLRIPVHPGVPDDVHREVVAQHDAFRKAEEAYRAEQVARIGTAIDAGRKLRLELLGPQRERFQALMHDEWSREAPTMSASELRAMRAAGRERVGDAMRAAHVDLGKLDEADTNTANAVTHLTEALGGSGVATPAKQGLPPPPPPNALVFKPPLDIGTWDDRPTWGDMDFSFTGFFLNHKPSGNLGHVNQIEMWGDVDNFEKAVGTMRSLFAIWMQLPKGTKQVDIAANVFPVSTFHAFNLEDDWYGKSHSHSFTSSRMYSEFFGTNGSSKSVAFVSFMGGPATLDNPDNAEGVRLQQFVNPNGPMSSFGWTADVPGLNKANWVFAWIGIETVNDLFLDDVHGFGAVTSRWRYDSIVVTPK